MSELDDMTAEITRLRKENEQLRKALRDIDKWLGEFPLIEAPYNLGTMREALVSLLESAKGQRENRVTKDD